MKPGKEKVTKLKTPWPKRKRLLLFLISFGLVGVFLVLLGGTGFFTYQNVRAKINSGSNHLQAVLDLTKADPPSISLATFDRALQEIKAAGEDFRLASESLGGFSFFLPLAEIVPGPGYDIANLEHFLEMGRQGSLIGELALEGVRPAVEAFDLAKSSGEKTPGGPSHLMSSVNALALPESQAKFRQAAILFPALSLQLKDIDPARLNLEQTRKAVSLLNQQLPNLFQALKLAQELPPILSRLLGKDGPTEYLVLIQNSDELRPTGGYIGTVASLTINQGKISLTNYEDISFGPNDKPKDPPILPPEPLLHYMHTYNFFPRDANWWPDFPTSGLQFLNLYKEYYGRDLDNLVAIDAKFVGYLFEALGPVDLLSSNERLSSANIEDWLRSNYLPINEVVYGGLPPQDRKKFLGLALGGLLERFNAATTPDYLKLVKLLSQAVSEKHLQIFTKTPDLESKLKEYELDGSLIDSSSQPDSYQDYLMVVDSNIGFNKINGEIEQTLNYSLKNSNSQSDNFASLVLTYTNKAGWNRTVTNHEVCDRFNIGEIKTYQDARTGCYYDYLRVYVPQGSILTGITGNSPDSPPLTSFENNKTVFATQLIVSPGQTVTVTLKYLLPGQIPSPRGYSLTLQQQAGRPPIPLQVNLNIQGEILDWSGLFNKDWLLEVKENK